MNDMRSVDPAVTVPSSLPLKSSKISHTLQSRNLWRPHWNQSTTGFWNWNSTGNDNKGKWFLCWRTSIWLYNLQHGASKTGYHLKLLDSIPSLVKSLVKFLCIHVLKMMLKSPFLNSMLLSLSGNDGYRDNSVFGIVHRTWFWGVKRSWYSRFLGLLRSTHATCIERFRMHFSERNED